ncbi:MAG: phosphonate ABC transporter, permease protein PhnE [Actinomycetota bacterium]|nr:phosphonate ABC transporter, permease protein PhnE [Actinomycetota bacterium]
MTATATRVQAAPTPSRPARPRRSLFWTASLVLTAVLVGWAAVGLDAKWERLISAPADMWRLAQLMFGNMTWSDVGRLLDAMWDSIAIAWLGTMLAAAVAVPLAFLAARNLGGTLVSLVIRQCFNMLRALPEVILVIAFIPIFGLSLNAGVLAIAIGSIGTLGKLCAEILEGLDDGPLEAADAAGANRLQRLRWGVLPQALPELMSFVLYRFEINIRVSAVLGAVGAGGIGGTLVNALSFNEFGVAGLALIIVVLGTIAVDMISGWVRRRIIAGPRSERRHGDVAPDALAADALTATL